MHTVGAAVLEGALHGVRLAGSGLPVGEHRAVVPSPGPSLPILLGGGDDPDS